MRKNMNNVKSVKVKTLRNITNFLDKEIRDKDNIENINIVMVGTPSDVLDAIESGAISEETLYDIGFNEFGMHGDTFTETQEFNDRLEDFIYDGDLAFVFPITSVGYANKKVHNKFSNWELPTLSLSEYFTSLASEYGNEISKPDLSKIKVSNSFGESLPNWYDVRYITFYANSVILSEYPLNDVKYIEGLTKK
jgi:hypothetical protein